MSNSRLSVFTCVLTAAFVGGMAFTSAVGAETDADDEVVKWLDRLEERGQKIATLSGKVSHAREDALLGEEQIRIGEVWYAAGDEEESARFAIHFDQLLIDDALRQQNRKYIFDGEWLAEVQEERRLFHRRQIVPPGERVDPLQVDGPFPLPIGQRRDDVLARFHVELVEPDEAAPEDEGQVRLRLVPRDDVARSPDEAKFDSVEMWFDRETLLPSRVETRERQYRTTVTLSDKQIDQMDEQELAERFDTTPPEPEGRWRVEITPWDEQD